MNVPALHKPAANSALVVQATVEAYALAPCFVTVDWAEGGIVSLIGLGEKVDGREDFRDLKFIDPSEGFALPAVHDKRWAEQREIGAFIVPAVLHPSARLVGDVKAEQDQRRSPPWLWIWTRATPTRACRIWRSIWASRRWWLDRRAHRRRLRQVHAYWRFAEPTEEVEAVGVTRKLMAAKVGGDQAFGRATQVIRLPGSLHYREQAAARHHPHEHRPRL